MGVQVGDNGLIEAHGRSRGVVAPRRVKDAVTKTAGGGEVRAEPIDVELPPRSAICDSGSVEFKINA